MISLKNITSLDKRVMAGFILIFLPICLFIILLILYTSGSQTIQTEPNIIAPTKFVLHNAIVSINPMPESVNVGIYSNIEVVFKNPVVESEKNRVRFTTTPATSGSASLSADARKITYTPDKSLTPNMIYKTVFEFTEGKQIWTFTTVPSDKVSNEDALKKQAESDIQTAESLKQFYTEFPWWNNFPLKSEQYFVYFNPDRNIFIGLLYPKTNTTSSVDQQVANMKNEILSRIAGLGIQVNNFSIEWKITPEP